MNINIGDKIFQNTPRRAAKFRENRPRDVEKSVVGKKIKHDQNIIVFRYRWSDTRATVIRLAFASATVRLYTVDGRHCWQLELSESGV